MSAWINQIFSAGQVNKGNVVRRSLQTVLKYASIHDLEVEVKKRGYHMVRINDQFVILCDPNGNMQMVC